MGLDSSRYRLAAAALGAAMLAASVFLPWYGLSFTAAGVGVAQHLGDQLAAQFGNATLQSLMTGFHAEWAALAALLVIYRMASPPLSAGNLVAVSLREGPWLALLGSAAMVVAGLWPRRERVRSAGGARDQDVWSSMSGWTPQG
jgi:hypothetical protein